MSLVESEGLEFWKKDSDWRVALYGFLKENGKYLRTMDEVKSSLAAVRLQAQTAKRF